MIPSPRHGEGDPGAASPVYSACSTSSIGNLTTADDATATAAEGDGSQGDGDDGDGYGDSLAGMTQGDGRVAGAPEFDDESNDAVYEPAEEGRNDDSNDHHSIPSASPESATTAVEATAAAATAATVSAAAAALAPELERASPSSPRLEKWPGFPSPSMAFARAAPMETPKGLLPPSPYVLRFIHQVKKWWCTARHFWFSSVVMQCAWYRVVHEHLSSLVGGCE